MRARAKVAVASADVPLVGVAAGLSVVDGATVAVGAVAATDDCVVVTLLIAVTPATSVVAVGSADEARATTAAIAAAIAAAVPRSVATNTAQERQRGSGIWELVMKSIMHAFQTPPLFEMPPTRT